MRITAEPGLICNTEKCDPEAELADALSVTQLLQCLRDESASGLRRSDHPPETNDLMEVQWPRLMIPSNDPEDTPVP